MCAPARLRLSIMTKVLAYIDNYILCRVNYQSQLPILLKCDTWNRETSLCAPAWLRVGIMTKVLAYTLMTIFYVESTPGVNYLCLPMILKCDTWNRETSLCSLAWLRASIKTKLITIYYVGSNICAIIMKVLYLEPRDILVCPGMA